MWKKYLAIMLSLSILFCAVPGVSEEEEKNVTDEAVSLADESVNAAGSEESVSASEPIAAEAALSVSDLAHATEEIAEQTGAETAIGNQEDSAVTAVQAADQDAGEAADPSSNENAGVNETESTESTAAETADSFTDADPAGTEVPAAGETEEENADKTADEDAVVLDDGAADLTVNGMPAADELPVQDGTNDEESAAEPEEPETGPSLPEESSMILRAAAAEPEKNLAPLNQMAAPAGTEGGSSDPSVRKTRIAVLSDIHYVSDQLSETGKMNVAIVGQTEGRLTTEIGMILDAALKDAAAAQPDALLVCGDLVSNGELSGARTLAEKLKDAKNMDGLKDAGIYVVNGNHDINNSYAADFTDENIKNGKRVQPGEFTEVFSGLGYGADDHCEGGSHSVYTPSGDNPYEVANHGGLSYRSDIADGITLIVLDTAIYRTDTEESTRYGEAQQTAGYVSDDLLQWAAEQAKDASAAGNLVLVMSHHGLIPHYDTALEEEAAWYYDSFRIPNWKKVADTLADAGVTAVLTGHTHANDIAKHVSENNNVLYDIETAALCAYPCAWRTIDIETSGEGKEKSCTISVNTSDIEIESGESTQSWTFSLSGKENPKTYNEDYNGDLQTYAYDKTGINGDFLKNAAEYMIKSTLYSVVHNEGGLEGLIKEKLNLEENKTVGQWAKEALLNVVDARLSDLRLNTELFGSKLELHVQKKETEEQADASFDIDLKVDDAPESGSLSLDLGYLPTAVNGLISSVQKKLEEGGWTTNNYQSNPLLDDVNKIVRNALLPALEKPLDENDPDSSAVKMINESWQTFSRGDEGLASEEQKARWKHQQELLSGEKLSEIVGANLWAEVKKLKESYPVIAGELSRSIVEEGKTSVIHLEYEDGASALILADIFLGINKMNTFSDLLKVTNVVDLSSSISSSLKPIVDKVAGLHHVQTTDTNIPHDNQWQFHSVRFDANGGTVAQDRSLTVEDHRLAGLPEPEAREGYTFDGWFTAPEGGSRVSAEDDMSETLVLYAHWTPVQNDEPDQPENRDEPDQPENRDEPDANESETQNQDKADRQTSAVAAAIKTSPKAKDLHILLGGREQVHTQLRDRERNQDTHAQFCAELAEQLKNGKTSIRMGSWLTLNGEAVQALMSAKKELTIEFTLQEKLYRTRIPAGADMTPYLQADGSLCILCLAEAFGYESADPLD